MKNEIEGVVWLNGEAQFKIGRNMNLSTLTAYDETGI